MTEIGKILFLIFIIVIKTSCYEKTLRKIVRNHSKMVQKPFSDEGIGTKISWRNGSLEPSNELIFSSRTQAKGKMQRMQRSKISTILSPIDTRNSIKSGSNVNTLPNEPRLTRNTINNTLSFQRYKGDTMYPGHHRLRKNNSYPSDTSIDAYYDMPNPQATFLHASNNVSANILLGSSNEENILIPQNVSIANDSLLVKGIYVASSKFSKPDSQRVDLSSELESDSADFLIQVKPVDDILRNYSYSLLKNIYSCTTIRKSVADIDAQIKFNELDIEPLWSSKKHYWDQIYDNRYETLMRDPNWPPLKVILVPRSHVDSLWKKSFERYHEDTVHKILSNVVKKLRFYRNLTFIWNEVSHLSRWWKTASTKIRLNFRRLLKEERLEITTGGWVETDEATAHLFGLVHQLVEGHQWLKNNLNYSPSVAWLTSSVAHSPTMAYILTASGITNLVITNLHYSWEEFFAEYRYSDFMWLQSWNTDKSNPSKINSALGRIGNDRFPKHSVLTHFMQFNSDAFEACGPTKQMCIKDFNFAKFSKNPEVYDYNVKEKAEILLEQYSKTGTITPHNIIIAPLGGHYHYETQAEFDYQYNNYRKLADFINTNRNIYKATVEFGTAGDYFKTLLQRHKHFITMRGDFVNYADLKNGRPAYWAGYFTSRPLFKILLRRLQATLRSTEILFSFALSSKAFQGFNTKATLFDLLIKARETVARLQDRNVVSGSLSFNTQKYAYERILTTVKSCWYIQEISTSLLSVKPNRVIHSPYLRKYVIRDGDLISAFKSVRAGDQIYVFNSLCHERTEIIELIVKNPNIRIIDHNKKDVTIQINPVWNYNSDNIIRISQSFYKITFAIVVPPLTLELYRIKETYDVSLNAATIYCLACIVDDPQDDSPPFPFSIQPVESGEIQLESFKHRLIFDEYTGFLKHVVEKQTGLEKSVVMDYGAFRSSDVDSGIFLFNTNVSKPLRDILRPYKYGLKSKVIIIVSGQITTELTSIFGRFLQSSAKIFNLLNSPLSNAIYVESKVDYESSPKNRELELFLSIQTDISNGNPPILFTDNNGFQYTARILNISRRIESNMYPMTTMSYIQDRKSRITVVTDHAQGVTALQEGQIVVMLDRRVLFDDNRGTGEGLADSSATCHRHYILLENFIDQSYTNFNAPTTLSSLELPSLSATYLANSLDYQLDTFIIDKNETEFCYYAFLPLVKSPLPCDVSIINYRVNFNKKPMRNHIPGSALMILHRQSTSCNIRHDDVQLHCNGDDTFILQKTFHNIKAAYQTNLCGTSRGVPLSNLNYKNFPSMELMSILIHF